MTQATQSEMNRFVKEVDSFMANLKTLDSSANRAAVYASNDSKLIDEYETTINRGNILQSTIEATTGAWNTAKQSYAAMTGETSMFIGDAVDEIRSWFGRDVPGSDLGGLGVIQLPAAAWIAGIVSAAYLLNQSMKRLMLQIDASKLRRENPGLSYDQAIAKARTASAAGGLFSVDMLPLVLAGGVALWFLFGRKK